MATNKGHVIAEIKRLAALHGRAPGATLFQRETGIRPNDWFPHMWLRWGDALREAGFAANNLQEAFGTDHLLEQFASFAKRLGHLPVKGEMVVESKANQTFPSHNTFRRFGGKQNLIVAVAAFCKSKGGFDDVIAMCEGATTSSGDPDSSESPEENSKVGYVYLLRHGSRQEYKIGKTINPVRREGEIDIELPQGVKPIHVIATDDPAGIEGYWHRRFGAKRLNGEWFALTASDVRSFKRWRRII